MWAIQPKGCGDSSRLASEPKVTARDGWRPDEPDATGGAEHAHTDAKQAQAEGVHLGIGQLGAACGAAEHIHEDVGGGVQEQANWLAQKR